MTLTREYSPQEPPRADIDRLAGATLLEFGSPWCGYCRRAEPLIEQALAGYDDVRHIRIADASRRRLGRSFGVKLWPTLVFLKDGREITRLVRPVSAEDIRRGLAALHDGDQAAATASSGRSAFRG